MNVTGSIKWEDRFNEENTRPQEVTVYLYEEGVSQPLDMEAVTAGEGDRWEFKFEGWPLFRNGKEIQYLVKQKDVEGYTWVESHHKAYDNNRNLTLISTLTDTSDAILPAYDQIAFTIKQPVKGEALAATTRNDRFILLRDTKGNHPDITLDPVSIEWTPSDNPAKGNRKYQVTIRFEKGEEWRFAKTVKGLLSVSKSDDVADVTNLNGSAERASDGSVTFHALLSTGGSLTVKNPEDQYYSNGTNKLLFQLPKVVYLQGEDGTWYEGTPTWDESVLSSYDPSKRETQRFTMKTSSIKTPAGISADNTLQAQFILTVGAVDALLPPKATPETGTYSGAQNVTLLSDQDKVDIWYAVYDWSDVLKSEYKKYDGNPIAITESSVISAYCVKQGESGDTPQSSTVKFLYKIEGEKHKVTVTNGTGSGE